MSYQFNYNCVKLSSKERGVKLYVQDYFNYVKCPYKETGICIWGDSSVGKLLATPTWHLEFRNMKQQSNVIFPKSLNSRFWHSNILEEDLKNLLGKLINDDKNDRYKCEGKFNQSPEKKVNNLKGKVNKIDKKVDLWRKKQNEEKLRKKLKYWKESRNVLSIFLRNQVKITGK